MRKNDFITLVLGVVGGLMFSIGMCMCLLPEWNAFQEGVIVTAIGAVVLLALVVVRFIKSGKKMKKVNWKTAGKVLFGIFGALVLGTGMSLVLVFGQMLLGILVGVAGVVLLLCLIPMCVGFKK